MRTHRWSPGPTCRPGRYRVSRAARRQHGASEHFRERSRWRRLATMTETKKNPDNTSTQLYIGNPHVCGCVFMHIEVILAQVQRRHDRRYDAALDCRVPSCLLEEVKGSKPILTALRQDWRARHVGCSEPRQSKKPTPDKEADRRTSSSIILSSFYAVGEGRS